MRPTNNLGVLQKSALFNLARIRKNLDRNFAVLTSHAASQTDRRTSRQLIAYCAIEALNTWSNFVRYYYLSCTLKPYRTKRSRVTYANAAVKTFEDAIRVATLLHRPYRVPPTGPVHRKDEPTWHSAHVLLTSCGALNCSHMPDVSAALSVGTRVLTDLPTIRNFFAHRNAGTENAVRTVALIYAIPSNKHPVEILATPPARRPQPLMLDWVDDLHALIELLCE